MQLLDLWLVLLGILVLMARLGLCVYLSGASRSKNAAGAILRGITDLCAAVLIFWAIGDAILQGDYHAAFGLHDSFGAAAFFSTTIILIATGAALGGTLERTKFSVPLVGSAALAGVVVPLAGRWAWSGWLANLGFIDIGGAAVLHVCGGVCAAAGAILAGARNGKYNRDGSANLIPGHSAPLTAVGAMAIVIGLLAQIAGCSILRDFSAAAADFGELGRAVGNGLLAAAAGGLAALLLGEFRYRAADFHFVITGLLSGVIASSAGAGELSSPAAVFIGAMAGLLAPMAAVWLDLRRKIDDPGSSVAIHLVGGAWGVLAAGLLVHSEQGILRQLLVQCAGLAAIFILATILCGAAFFILKATLGLRLSEADELDGGDLVEHDLNAYPDFQQTMIKSYHLRET